MATGKIKRFNVERKYGWIENDAGGPDIFLHITEVLQEDITNLVPRATVEFEIQPSNRRSGRLDAHNVRFQGTPSPRPVPSSSETHDSFHNPYTFTPTPPRQDAIKGGGFASDFDPLEHDLNHATLQPNLWTGHLPINLTTVTPLLLPDTNNEQSSSNDHKIYPMLDHLPESSLRGMLRSAYEVVTNSRYTCFRNDDRLAYRMKPQEALKLIPAIIEDDKDNHGELVARLYPGTSTATAQGPKKDAAPKEKAMYAAMLTRYHNNSSLKSDCAEGYDPKTGDEVWAEIVLCQHEVSLKNKKNWRKDYTFWKVITVWHKQKQKPSPTTKCSWYSQKPKPTTKKKQSYYAPLNNPNNPQRKIIKGSVLITNENMGNKHDERIFFGAASTFSVTHLKEAWRMRIQSYRDAHREDEIFEREVDPWEKIGNAPGKTAWSPHLYQDGKHPDRWSHPAHDAKELQPGDMVYARCKFDAGKITDIEDIFPVMISRELYDDSPENLLDDSLKPAKKLSELSPADRLFGWVPQEQGDDPYKSRLRVVCEDGSRPDIIQKFDNDLPLTILGQPKPAQGRFYVAKDAKGTPQNAGISKQDAGYSTGKALRGRKQYWHHKGLEASQAQDYWNPSVEDRTHQQSNGRYQEYRRPDKDGSQQKDSQNRSIKGWINSGTVFKATLYVQNLQSEEVGALLWLLSLPENHYFRLGYGKPLGFGSVRMEIDEDRCVNGCLPLGTGKNWKEYYAAFDVSSPATLDDAQQNTYIQAFKASMVAAYNPLPPNDETSEKGAEHEASRASHRLTSFDDLKYVPIRTTRTTPENRKRFEEQRFAELPFIKGLLQVLSGPGEDAPIHYPRQEQEPKPEGENFKWFVANERDEKVALPAVTDAAGLPYQP